MVERSDFELMERKIKLVLQLTVRQTIRRGRYCLRIITAWLGQGKRTRHGDGTSRMFRLQL